MLTLYPRHIRLQIEDGMTLEEIPEAFRMFVQVCRFNDIDNALITNAHPQWLDVRAGIRASLRSMFARAMMPPIRLALVALNDDGNKALIGVKQFAIENSIPCELFTDEARGIAWFAKFDGGKVIAIR
jgi:hypothetical protein